MLHPTSTKHRKRKNKHTNLRATIQRRRDNIVILIKQLGMIPPEPELGRKSQQEVRHDGGVNTHEQPAHVPEDDRGVEVREDRVRVVSVGEPEGYRHDEADEVGYCDPFIAAADGEHVVGDAPGYGETVELVWGY